MEATKLELPIYTCHKKVGGLKIKQLDIVCDENSHKASMLVITPEEEGYSPFGVDKAYLDKHEPQVGGYYVIYEDGYESYSPAKAFEGGYTLESEVVKRFLVVYDNSSGVAELSNVGVFEAENKSDAIEEAKGQWNTSGKLTAFDLAECPDGWMDGWSYFI